MSRFVTKTDNGYIEEIESMEVCKHSINDVCCNGMCDCVGHYRMGLDCTTQDGCDDFEKEDGIIENEQ